MPAQSWKPKLSSAAQRDSFPGLNKGLGLGGGLNLHDPTHRYYFIHGYEAGFHWIRQNPALAARLLAAKTSRWLDGFRSGWGISNFPAGLSGVRPPVDLFVGRQGLIQAVALSLLVTAGCFLSCFKPNRAFLIATFVVLHRVALTLAFFGYARGLVVILPAILPLVLLPLIRVAQRFRIPDPTWAAAAAGILALFFLHAVVIAGGQPRSFQVSGPSDSSGKIIQDAAVTIWPPPE